MPSVRELRRALEEQDRKAIDAFLESVRRIQGNIAFSRVVEAVESGNAQAVFDVLGINAGSYQDFDEALRQAFIVGGALEVSDLPTIQMPGGSIVTFGFNARNARAEEFLRTQSSSLVVQINQAQLDAIRVILETGSQRGQNPRQTALDIVGRVNRQTRRREGGVIGLDPALARSAARARAELLSSDPAELARALDRKLISASGKAQIRRAIDSGDRLPMAAARRIAIMYESSLLKLRGDRIARTETLKSYEAGRAESVRQVIDTGATKGDVVLKKWDAAGDNRVRDTHRQEDGQTVPQDHPFILSSGARLMFPGDTSLGAPAEEVINCRCITTYEYDFIGRAVRRARSG